MVSGCDSDNINITKDLSNSTMNNFVGGNIANCYDNWTKLTSDEFILQCVRGCHITFTHTPRQYAVPNIIRFNECERSIVNEEVKKLRLKQVIEPVPHETDEYISNVFLRLKKNGKYRLIINLRPLNKLVEYQHFKMDSIHTCIALMKQNCYMASLDLQDAYYSVPVAQDFRKFLKFKWNGELYQFNSLPMGLACAPRIFTKILKPVFSHLREQGHVSSGYIDDTFLEGDTYDICKQNVTATLELLDELGFSVQREKSVTEPTQIMEHLGFILNSLNMTVTLTSEKYNTIGEKASHLLSNSNPTIREVASVIGTFISYLPGVQYGALYYRHLELDKIAALKESKGNFEATMTLSNEARADLRWWIENAHTCPVYVNHGEPEFELFTDASGHGWGCHYGDVKTGGRWNTSEKEKHINVLELTAVLFSLQSLFHSHSNTHIRLRVDNTTAVTYINNMGGVKSPTCNAVTKLIWEFCITRNIWITCSHICGSENIIADKKSRLFNDQTEWMLHPDLFKSITKCLLEPTIDLFASRLNKQLPVYVSWEPDPEAFDTDAFSLSWNKHLLYIFCPFSLIHKALQKVELEKGEGLIIVPLWTTQSWYPKLLRLLVKPPILLPRKTNTLSLPFSPTEIHPLAKKMTLMACHISGRGCESSAFRRNLRMSSATHGGQGRSANTVPTSPSGHYFVVDGVKIPCNQLSHW